MKKLATARYLVNLIDLADKGHHVGTMILTDFLKTTPFLSRKRSAWESVGPLFLGFVTSSIIVDSEWCSFWLCSTTWGVPHGTKLGPTCFQILINEAAESSSSKCWKYVGNLTFAGICSCSQHPSSSLQSDLYNFTNCWRIIWSS